MMICDAKQKWRVIKKGEKNAGYTLDNLSWRVETKCACPALNFINNFFCFVRQLRDCQCVLSGGGSTNTQVIIILVCFRLVENVSSGVRSHREMFFNSTISCHFCRFLGNYRYGTYLSTVGFLLFLANNSSYFLVKKSLLSVVKHFYLF